ncbi:hypothetical protein KAU40_02470 [Candidatus Parcubacteria bacterium]|nr:hypothetical protein [Candidatus Parcubacteria bacterium]
MENKKIVFLLAIAVLAVIALSGCIDILKEETKVSLQEGEIVKVFNEYDIELKEIVISPHSAKMDEAKITISKDGDNIIGDLYFRLDVPEEIEELDITLKVIDREKKYATLHISRQKPIQDIPKDII